MWICPKCNRKFKNVNQSHYCGKTPDTVDDYIMAQDEDKRRDLFCMRDILRRALPQAEEK